MRLIYFVLACLLLTGCLKADIAPALTPAKSNTIQNISNTKADTVKDASYSPDTDTSNPDYWYNGTKGTAVIQLTCKDCDAIATIGTVTIPFIFNAEGVGMLKYTPAAGLVIKLAVCPGSANPIKADIFDGSNKALFSYSGTISGNWSGTYIIK